MGGDDGRQWALLEQMQQDMAALEMDNARLKVELVSVGRDGECGKGAVQWNSVV